MRLRLAPYLRKPPPIFASGKHFVQLYHWQTSHTQERCAKSLRSFTQWAAVPASWLVASRRRTTDGYPKFLSLAFGGSKNFG